MNSVWHGDSKWRHRSVSTLSQALACCLTALLEDCRLIVKSVSGIHLNAVSQEVPMHLIGNNCSDTAHLISLPHLPGASELNGRY